MPDFVAPGAPVEAIWGNDVVAALQAVLVAMQSLMPIGSCVPFGGTTEPENWLFCRGQAVSQTTWSALYAVIGTKFAAGMPAAPAGQFRVPNLQARVPVGTNVSGGSAGIGNYWTRGVGEVAGDYDPVMPNHTHLLGDHVHPVDFVTGDETDAHYHNGATGALTMEGHGPYDIPLHYLPRGVGTDIGGPHYFHFGSTTNESGPHKHPVKGETRPAGGSTGQTQPAGGGAQVPPGVAFNWIIRGK